MNKNQESYIHMRMKNAYYVRIKKAHNEKVKSLLIKREAYIRLISLKM